MKLSHYLDLRNFLQIPHCACAQSLLFILSLEKHVNHGIRSQFVKHLSQFYILLNVPLCHSTTDIKRILDHWKKTK